MRPSKRKYQYILFLLLMAYNLQGQKLSFGVSAFPYISFNTNKTSYLAGTEPEFNGAIAGTCFYDISTSTQLLTEVSFRRFNFNFIDYNMFWPSDHDGFGGALPFRSFLKGESENNFISFALKGRQKILGDENHFYLSAGLGFWQKIYSKSFDTHCVGGICRPMVQDNNLNLRNNLVTSSLGLGYEFKFLPKTKIFIEPNLEYHFQSIYSSDAVLSNGTLAEKVAVWNLGCKVGVRFINLDKNG